MRLRLGSWILALGLIYSVGSYAQPRALPPAYTVTPGNYVKTYEANAPIYTIGTLLARPTKDVRQATQYMDGLGRPIQTVVKEGSLATSGAVFKDIVNAVDIDQYGREIYKYGAFPSQTNTGVFKLAPFSEQQTFMTQQYSGQNETYFYSQVQFEASPDNRPQLTMAPGNSWVGSSRGVGAGYWNNAVADSVVSWQVADVANSWGTYAAGPIYAAGTLSKSIVTDESGNQVVEFKDFEGNVVLKKVKIGGSGDNGSGSGHANWLCTYYIYDSYGKLRCVIQPLGVQLLAASGWSLTSTILSEQCFRYEYDQRNRMVMKQVPGSAEVWMVYDNRDRLILTQDGKLRGGSPAQWLYTIYDSLNRPVSTGLWNSTLTRLQHKATADTSILYPNLTGQTYTELTSTFYDNYSWLANYGSPLPSTYDASYNTYLQSPSTTTWPYPVSYSAPNVQATNLKGVVTGGRTLIIGSSTYLYQVSIYDQFGHVVQSQNTNQTGGTDIVTNQYAWNGKVLVSVHRQVKNGTNSQNFTDVSQITYDDLFRVIKAEKKVQSSKVAAGAMPAFRTIYLNEYDALGQMKKRTLSPAGGPGGGLLDTLTYDYNIRGWMLGMNRLYAKDTHQNNYFGFDLGYDKTSNGIIGNLSYTAAQYNGNISGTVWKSKGDQEKRKYDFTYDAANRLLRADFTQYISSAFSISPDVDFTMKMGDGVNYASAYDANGNILQMQQWGIKGTTKAQIDNLSYAYLTSSNKLKSVTDAAVNTGAVLGDFKDGTNGAADDYTYDVNGNLNQDLNKNIASITYNHLNLPSVITVTGKGTITYTYDAAGNKLTKTVAETGQTVKTNQYVGGAVYLNDTLQFISHEEGRIRFKPAKGAFGDSLYYDYMEKDHLGNVRALLTEEKQTDLYPAATMELANQSSESIYYSNISTTASTKPTGYPTDNSTTPNNYAAKVNGSGNKIGPAIMLKVMAGDQFNVQVTSWYKLNGVTPGTPNPITELAAALANAMSGLSSGKATSGDLTSSGLPSSDAITFFGTQSGYTTSKPKAFLNWILLDEQFRIAKDASGNPVASGYSGFDQVGTDQQFKSHVFSNMPIAKSGYLYIYVSNETPNIDVYFDNLQVTQIRGPLLEESHYYPFGLTMAGISDRSLGGVENKRFRFQGQELSNKEFTDGSGLDIYEFRWRMEDVQIGRFWQKDPLSDKYTANSLYAFSENKVTSHIELEGLESLSIKDVKNVYFKSGMQNNVLTPMRSMQKNLQGSVEFEATVGFGVGLKGGVGKVKGEIGASGPELKAKSNLGGEYQVNTSLAGAGGKIETPIGNAKVGGSVINTSLNNEGGSFDPGSAGMSGELKLSKEKEIDKKNNAKATSDVDLVDFALNFGVKTGVAGFDITIDVVKLGNASKDFFVALGNFLGNVVEEKTKIPKSSDFKTQ